MPQDKVLVLEDSLISSQVLMFLLNLEMTQELQVTSVISVI